MAETAIQLREQQKAIRFNSVRKMLESPKIMDQVKRALPVHMPPERIIRVAVSAVQKNPRLLDCSEGSLVRSIIEAAELGLEVNTNLGQAYIIPYGQEATLQVGYRGFITLAHRSGKIANLQAEVVYSNDQFEIQLGTRRGLFHQPAKTNRGEPIGAYATVFYRDGSTDFEYMSSDEIGAIKLRSSGAKKADSPWNRPGDELEMWRKTPIRRLAKRLPMTADDANLLQKAAVLDEYNAAGFIEPPAEIEKAPTITEEQRTALVVAARTSGADLSTIVNDAGFAVLADITTEAYDEILATVSVTPVSPGPDTDSIDGEPVFDEDEAILIDLREAVSTAIAEKVGKRPNDQALYLKGRDVKTMSAEELDDMLHELQNM